MTSKQDRGLLTSRDAQPVDVTNRAGASLFLLLGDHAGNGVPERLHGLELPAAELGRHIAIDLGVAELGHRLSALLDAPFIEQRYSRLVIDCNRDPDHPGSIAAVSDGTVVPGNADLSPHDRKARAEAIFDPYHQAVAALIAERERTGRRCIVVSLHSFTPVMNGLARPWEVGVLHDGGDASFAAAVLCACRAAPELVVGDNEPYRMDGTDFTVPYHAFGAGRAYVELEVRQDELATPAGVLRVADLLHGVLNEAASVLADDA